MPELQPSTPAPSLPGGFDAAPGFDETDYAFGCECADPSLQIERWGQEAGVADGN
jgi:hypothetical protein